MNPEITVRLPKGIAMGCDQDHILLHLTHLEAQSLLDQLATPLADQFSLEHVENLVCQALKLNVSELHGPDRRSCIVNARRLCFQLASERGFNPAKIAAYFGLDRTDIVHNMKRFKEILPQDHNLQHLLSNLRARL